MDDKGTAAPDKQAAPRRARRHCNGLDGKRWLQNSISVWNDIRKTPEESRLGHPALFPGMLVQRLIETFLPPEGDVVLDPFAGSGSTIVAAERMGKRGIGLELSPEYVELAHRRLDEAAAERDAQSQPDNGDAAAANSPRSRIVQASAGELLTHVEAETVDVCISSPPYWDILNQRRTADLKSVRHYGNLDGDLGTIADYEQFVEAAAAVFGEVLTTLKPGGFCCVIVMDLRKKSRFYPLHSDLATRLTELGYIFDDLVIWNRQTEYNNLRPLGYPSVFRINKVHEYILLMQKPR